jgi:hypothetical protein
MREEGLVAGCGLCPMAFRQPALPVGGLKLKKMALSEGAT